MQKERISWTKEATQEVKKQFEAYILGNIKKHYPGMLLLSV